MGNYIEVPANKGKVQQILTGKVLIQKSGDPANPFDKFSPATDWEYAPQYTAEVVATAPAWEDIPEDKALVVVVANPLFEAAALADDKYNYDAFTSPSDTRPRTYILMDKDVAFRAAGLS